ncbi:hypothetical protein HJC99_04505 [Candidatus Saccharibacteria bacterium]|nr:hypothetical protein [Candidatus Saccharibacteria bacterium]
MSRLWLLKLNKRPAITRIYTALALAGLFWVGLITLNIPTASATGAAGIYSTINYQGRLLTSTGAVVPDGTYNMEFQIWQDGNGCVTGCTSANASTNNGGTLKWTEDYVYGTGSPDNRVTVKNGYFSVSLGSITSLSSVNFNWDTNYLTTNIGNTSTAATFSVASGDGYMIPFKRLSANPYALNSSQLGGLTSSQYTQLGQGIQGAATTGTTALIGLNQTSTGTILDLQKGGADVLLIDSTGSTLFRPTTDSAIALQVQKAGTTTTVFTVDSSNSRIGIGTAAPAYAVDAVGSINASTSLKVAGTDVCTTAGCTADPASAIKNQNSAQQTSANFWISGSGRADTSILTPGLDTATGVALAIGTTNATSINLNESTNVATGKTFTTNGSGFDATGKLGIGTTSPAANLDVHSTATTGNALSVTANNLTTGIAVNVSSSPTAGTGGALINASQSGTITTSGTVGGSLLNVQRSITANVSAASAITFDSKTTSSSYTWSHTVASQTNRILIVECDSSSAATSATYNGVAMTLIGTITNPSNPSALTFWKLLAPATGTHAVTMDQNCNVGAAIGGVSSSWYNVDQTTGTGTFSSNDAAANNVSVSVASLFGQVVIDGADAYLNGYSSWTNIPGSGQTMLLNPSLSYDSVGASYKAGAATSTTMTWNFSAGAGVHIYIGGFALIQAPTGSAVNLVGSIVNLGSNCTNTAGGCADNSSILSLNQQYASASGAVATLQNAGTGDMVDFLNGSSSILSGFDSSGNLFFNNSTFKSTLSTGTLSAPRSITLPDASGTVCLSVGNCSAAGGYIVNGTSLQASSNFHISGSGTADTSLLTPTLDTASASALSIGVTAATTIGLGRSGQTLNIGSDAINLNNGYLNVAGTTSATNSKASLAGTVASSTTSQYGLDNEVAFNPQVAITGAVYGSVNIPNLSGSALAVSSLQGFTAGVKETGGVGNFTGTVTDAIGLNITSPQITGGGNKFTTYTGVDVGANSINGGNTSGILTNNGIIVESISAGAGSGGTVNNYGINLAQPSGSGTGTTNNYGINIQGAGGGSNNYSIYNQSTAASYFSGNVGINQLTTGSYNLNVNGTANFATSINVPSITSSAGLTLATTGTNGLTADTGGAGTIKVGAANANSILIGTATTAQASGATGTIFIGNTNSTIVGISGQTVGVGSPSGGALFITGGGVNVQGASALAMLFNVTNTSNKTILHVDSSANVVSLGQTSNLTGQLQFSNATNAFTSTIQGNTAATASYTSILPGAVGSAGQCLTVASVASTTQTLGYSACGGGSYVTLQGVTPGTADTGNLNITGTGIFATQITSPIVKTTNLRPTADGTSAIQFQNAAGTTNVLTVDTTNSRINVGTNGTPTGQLYVSGTLPTAAAGSVSTGSAPNNIYVQGHYAYTANYSSSTLGIYDVSNPAAPFSVGSVSISIATNVYVQGRYAYVTSQGSGGIVIVDVSNPSSPISVGSVATGSNPKSIFVQGSYAYVVNNGASTISIVDVHNPASPTIIGSTATGLNPSSVYVQGRYAYVINNTASTLSIIDVNNPASPSSVGSVATGSNPNAVFVQDNYAYVTNNSGAGMSVIDVSAPSAPSSVGTVATGTSPNGIYVQGRYAYVANSGSNTIGIYDVGGAYTQQLEAGGAQLGMLAVDGNSTLAGDASVQGGLQVGQSVQIGGDAGINGGLSVGGSASFDGPVQVGSSLTDTTQVNLQLDSTSLFADSGTCSTTTNQGALYYNTNTNAIRSCVGGAWEDVITTSGLGLVLFGIVPDGVATTGVGDLAGAGGYNSGPCKVYMSGTANIIVWNSCTAYSSGRKVAVAAGTATVSSSTSVFQNLCINTSGVAALVGTANATETTAGLFPAFSPSAPILCLATIKTATVANKVAAIYDTRVYTTDDKTIATIATTTGLGSMVTNNGTLGRYAPTSAVTNSIMGVVVAYSGTVSTATPNAIIVTYGPVAIKGTGTSGTIAQMIEWGAANGYATTVAAATTATNPYTYAGVAQNTNGTVAAGCAVYTACSGSLFTTFAPR